MRSPIFLLTFFLIAIFAGAGLFAQDCENVEQIGRAYNFLDKESADDVHFQSEYAYIAAGISGLQILDLTDPENPIITGYWDDNPGFAKSVTINGNYAYLADEKGGLRVINVSNPENPVEIGFFDTNGEANGVAFFRDVIYLADGSEGLRIINVANPEHPEEIGFFDTAGFSKSVTICHLSSKREPLLSSKSEPATPACG